MEDDKDGKGKEPSEPLHKRLFGWMAPLDVVWLIGVFVVSVACGCVISLVALHLRW